MSTFQTKQSLGQNFIRDTGFLAGVVDKIGLASSDVVVEIGAGMGALTGVIASRAGRVITYEIDRRLERYLAESLAAYPNVEVHFADIMTITNFPPDFKIVANIPYYITTPIIFKFLLHEGCREICILVQDDVARRIVASPGTRDYGALSVGVQSRADCKIIRHVPKTLFHPRPKVDSAFVQIVKSKPAHIDARFDSFVKSMFSARRKTVANALKQMGVDAGGLETIGVSPNERAENLGVAQFLQIWDLIFSTECGIMRHE